MDRSISSLFVPVILIILTASCVSQSKYQKLEKTLADEQARQQAEIEALQKQKAALEKAAAELRTEKEQRGLEIASLSDQMNEMERQTAETSAQKDEEIQRLKGTYESLVSDLKGEIEKGEIKVTQIQDKLSVNLVEKILFDSGRAEVKPQGKEILAKVGNILKNVQDKEIRIEGYTDNVPIGGSLRQRFPTNWELSTQRATNVLRFLQEETGVEGAHLSAVGYGEFRPIAGNDTPEGRAQNRRIEIVLAPRVQEVLKELK